jgi:hydroxyethylthiazole kinase
MNSSANVLLALGASPLMAHAPEELAEIINCANVLVLNIGTLDNAWIASMQAAQRYALEKKIPIIVDPVGAGASTLRTQTAQAIIAQGVDIIRGNAGEIMTLANYSVNSKGVDSLIASQHAVMAAQQLATTYQCVVIVSGSDDFVVSQEDASKLSNGTPLFTKVTAMGCAATAVVGAFAAIENDYALAANYAMSVFAIAGQQAANKIEGPGSFYVNFIDQLYALSVTDLDILQLTFL